MKRLLYTLSVSLSCSLSMAQTTPPAQAIRENRAEPQHFQDGPLGRQASALLLEWGKEGNALRLPPRMLEQGRDFPIIVPSGLLSQDTEQCTTIAVIGTPNVSFLLAFDPDDQAPSRRAWPVPSAAGVAEVTRCGARKPLLSGLNVKMRSRRGVVEFVVLDSSHPPKPVADVLPHRNAGPSLPGPQVGKRPSLAPLKQRIEQRKSGYLSDGAHQILLSGATADKSGRGSFVVHLGEGCHQLDLMGDATSDVTPDLDARLTTLTQAEQIELDEEHSGQASLTHCVGRAERFRVEFSGAESENEITLLHAEWDLPDGIPISWGPVARAELARSMFMNGFPALDEAPSLSTLGVRGTTRLQADVDPESCYLMAIAPLRGVSERLVLGAELPHSLREAQSAQNHHGTSLQFCAQGADSVDIETQAMGDGLAWILGLWRVGSPTLGLSTNEPSADSEHGFRAATGTPAETGTHR